MTRFKEKRVKFQVILYCFLIPLQSNHMVVIYIYTKWVLIFQFLVTWIMVFGSCLVHGCLISHGEDFCF